MRDGIRLSTLVGVVTLAVWSSGCASIKPCDRSMIQFPPGEFSHVDLKNIDGDVADFLLVKGDYWRDLAYLNSFPVCNFDQAFWYAEESKRFYNHILTELEPQNAYATVNLGFLALLKARTAKSKVDMAAGFDTAYAKLTEADKKRKGNALAHIYLGELYALRKDWGKAEKEFSALITSGIEDSYIHSWWGYVLKAQGKKVEATEHFRKATELGRPERAATWAREQM